MSVPSSLSLDHVRESMNALGAAGLAIPAPSFTVMNCDVVDYMPGDSVAHLGARMIVRIPVLDQWKNPMGLMQGGALAMAIDNSIGPLSYLVAPPSSTTQLALTYLAPVTPDMEAITVESVFVHRAGRQLVFDAEVKGPDGTVLTAARATCQVVRISSPPTRSPSDEA